MGNSSKSWAGLLKVAWNMKLPIPTNIRDIKAHVYLISTFEYLTVNIIPKIAHKAIGIEEREL